MKKILLLILLTFGAAAAPAEPLKPDLTWIDRSMAHFLVSPQPYGGPFKLEVIPQTSAFFRQTIFTIDPRKYGPKVAVKAFLMEDFRRAVRRHFENQSSKAKDFTTEFTRIMQSRGLPTRLTPEEFQMMLANPEARRFASVMSLPEPMSHHHLNELKTKFQLGSVRDVIRNLREGPYDGVANAWNFEKAEALRQSIDRLLALDGDWEFCNHKLADEKQVPSAYLERLGYTLESPLK